MSSITQAALRAALDDRQLSARIQHTAAATIRRHEIAPMLAGAWKRRHNVRMVDALYVELAHRLGNVPLITTDERLAAVVPLAEVVR